MYQAAVEKADEEAAVKEDDADAESGRDSSPTNDAPTNKAASEPSRLSQSETLQRDYNSKQVSELSTLMGVVMAATSRVKAVRELLDSAQAAGLNVSASFATSAPFTAEPAVPECSAEELGAEVAARCMAVALARFVARADLRKIATLARQQITELYNAQRKAADKLLTFMLGDFGRRMSISIARFAVSANMHAEVLDELVDKVLSETSRLSAGVLNVAVERGDGAQTNLVREGCATARSSTQRGDNVQSQTSLPCSLREIALDDNAAVRSFVKEVEQVVLETFDAKGRPQSSAKTDVCQAAIKQHVFEVFCNIILPIPPSHSPNLRGWLHLPPGNAPPADPSEGAGAAAKRQKPTEAEGQDAKHSEEDDYCYLPMVVDEDEASDMQALRFLDETGGDVPTPMNTTTLPFTAPAQSSRLGLLQAARIASGPTRGRDGVVVRTQREASAVAPDASAAAASPDPAALASIAKPASASTADPPLAAAAAEAATASDAGTTGESAIPFEVRMHEDFSARVAAKRKGGAEHPEREALKGASFTSRSFTDRKEKELIERINRLRPPRHERPLWVKMQAKGLPPLTIDEYLKDSKLQPMPSVATPVDSSGLAACLLNSASSADAVHVRLQGAGRMSASADASNRSRLKQCTLKQLMLERYMREAVNDKSVTLTDMLAELRVALMDRMRHELAKFHGLSFGNEVLIRSGHWFVQCMPHKYKTLVRAIKNLIAKDEDEEGNGEQLSKRRLLEVADELVLNATSADDRKRFQTLQLALTGGTDMQSQAACIYLLICPEWLAALYDRKDCWREHTILYIYGQAWMAWDRPHLSKEERIRAIESYEALLCFNLGGEQLYLPFLNETTKGTNPGLKGVLANDMGSFLSSQNLLAFLSNGAVHRQFREQYPDEYAHAVERAFMNNDLETFHSEITQQLGIKPTMRNLQGRLVKIDFAMRQLFDPRRSYHITLSRKKMYDPVEFYLSRHIFEWNDGSAIDLQSDAGQKYLRTVAERAMNSAKGKQESIRSHFNRANKIVRDSIRALGTSVAASSAMDTDPGQPSAATKETADPTSLAQLPTAAEAKEEMDTSAADTSTAGESMKHDDGRKTEENNGEERSAHRGKGSRKVAFDAPASAPKRHQLRGPQDAPVSAAEGPLLRRAQEEGAVGCQLNEDLFVSLGLPPMGTSDGEAPLWLTRAHNSLELLLRTPDYWQDGLAVSGALASYWRSLGFLVEAEPVTEWQRGVSCGIVAADAVTTMRLAEQRQTGGWFEADTTRATDINVIKDANRRQLEWARAEECLSARALRSDPARTRFLKTDEVRALATQSWRRVGAPPVDEEEGPPCARCDNADHISADCPHFSHRRGRYDSETLTVGALDSAYAQIARELHAVATATDAETLGRQRHAVWPRYFISNNKKGGDGMGEHWFTVAYSIRRRQ